MRPLYQRFFTSLPIRFIDPDEDLEILTDDERYMVEQTEKSAYLASVLIELAAYLLTYLPIYAFPELFEHQTFRIGGPFANTGEPIQWFRNGWILLVNLGELYIQLLMNLAAVHGIAVATGYIRRDHPRAHVKGLMRIAMNRKFGGQQAYGIDPFQGMNHWLLYAYLLINRIKGWLGNMAMRAMVTNLFGAQIFRALLDFSGMPVYMLIDLYSTRVIVRNARVAVMGQAAVESVVRRMPTLMLDGFEKELVYDALQYVAINQRDYHINHFILTRDVLDRYGIPAESHHPLPADFSGKLRLVQPRVADLCRLIVVMGFILDGRISGHERRHLRLLRSQGALDLSERELKNYCSDFVDGRGLAGVTDRFLGH